MHLSFPPARPNTRPLPRLHPCLSPSLCVHMCMRACGSYASISPFMSTLKSHVHLQQNTEFTQLMCNIIFCKCVEKIVVTREMNWPVNPSLTAISSLTHVGRMVLSNKSHMTECLSQLLLSCSLIYFYYCSHQCNITQLC